MKEYYTRMMELVEELAENSVDSVVYQFASNELAQLKLEFVAAGGSGMDFDEAVDLCFDEFCSVGF